MLQDGLGLALGLGSLQKIYGLLRRRLLLGDCLSSF